MPEMAGQNGPETAEPRIQIGLLGEQLEFVDWRTSAGDRGRPGEISGLEPHPPRTLAEAAHEVCDADVVTGAGREDQ